MLCCLVRCAAKKPGGVILVTWVCRRGGVGKEKREGQLAYLGGRGERGGSTGPLGIEVRGALGRGGRH